MELKNNKVVLIIVGILAAYLVLVYLPRQQELKLRQQENTLIQQETNLRKQTYEICLKEWNDIGDGAGEFWARQVIAGQITQEELTQKVMDFATRKDEFLAKCVEKRLQEYNRQ